MSVKDNDRRKRQRMKESGKSRVGRYGRTLFPHSRKGAYSCYLAGGALFVAAAAVAVSCLMKGQAGGYIGAMSVLSICMTIEGLHMAMEGFREKDKSYGICKAGIAANLIILLFMATVFVVGCL